MKTMLVESVLPIARRRLATVGSDAALAEAARALCDGQINLVVVCDPDGTMAGVVTMTDVVRRLGDCPCREPDPCGEGAAMIPGRPKACACAMNVAEVMTRDIRSCRPDVLLSDVWSFMKEERLLHVPVVDDEARPLGVLNARDALQALLGEVEQEEILLRDYVMGIGYH